MLRAAVLPEVLNGILSSEITAVLLMNSDGALLGTAGSVEEINPKVVGAIVANIWSEYEESASKAVVDEALEFMNVELENGRVGIATAGNGFLVCAYSPKQAPLGFMKAKLGSLAEYLKDSFSKLVV